MARFIPSSALPAMAVLMMLVMDGAFAQAGDDYLKQLESEAGNLSLDGKTRVQNNRPGRMRDSVGLTRVPADDEVGMLPNFGRERFEQALRQNLMGSYMFYKRLDRDRQDRVYAGYLDNPDPDLLREFIKRMMKEQRGE